MCGSEVNFVLVSAEFLDINEINYVEGWNQNETGCVYVIFLEICVLGYYDKYSRNSIAL